MKVSVIIVTYNQEEFIEQAVESVLMQKANFAFEIIIGEDCSTDRTREIVLDLQRKNPDKIRLLLHERNLGGRGKFNFMETYGAARGQYVALLEGDDYWTSPDKLQKQVDFLDTHPECSACFHNTLLLHEDGSEPPRKLCRAGQQEFSTVEDILKENFIPTCSIVWRRGLFGELPAWFKDVPPGDWALHILNAEHGLIGYLNEVMGVYRIHKGGTWTNQGLLSNLEEIVSSYDIFDKHFDYKYRRIVGPAVSKLCCDLALGYEGRGDRAKAKVYALRCVTERLRGRTIPEGYLFGMILRLYVPAIYKPLHSLGRVLKRRFTGFAG